LALSFSAIVGTQLVHFSSANFIPEQPPEGIQITSAGTVEGTDLIQRSGNVYTLTGDIYNTIVVLCDGIVLDGAGYSLQGNGSGAGVFLQERNGVTIKNLKVSNFEYGIKFTRSFGPAKSRSNIVSGNTITHNTYGLYIDDFSEGNTISENSVADNTYGIHLASCSRNTLRGNHLENNSYGFFVSGGTLFYSINDVDQSNTINGSPIIYWLNQRGKTVPTNAGYVALVNCTEMTVENLDLAHNGQAMLLVALSNSTIVHNTITYNRNAIWLVESKNNQIIENTITSNANDAFLMISSSNNEITSNTLTGNGLNGTPIATAGGSNGRGALRLSQSSNSNYITGNKIFGNGEGINLQDSYCNNISTNFLADNDGSAVHFFESGNNSVTANTIIGNNGSGVKLWMSNQNEVCFNAILNNSLGIHLDAAAQNCILQNTIANSTGWGMQLDSASDTFLSSANNTIIHNNFINNQQNVGFGVSFPALLVYSEESVPGVGNAWDDGKEGNYWSDYGTLYPNASGVGSTGVGDTPYFINENNIDRHPLMAPCEISIADLPSTSPSQEPESEPEPFPAALAVVALIASVAVVGVGLLVYFKKRKP
jgi:parallel beta-helix repeat protein